MDETLRENYRRAYGTRVGFGKRPALLLIDFVQAYFDPACELYADVDAALASALRIRIAARAARVPVVLSRVSYQADGCNGGRFFEKASPLRHFLPGSPLGDWPAGLLPEPGEIIISKQYPSIFFGTSLASTLTFLGRDSVILTGLTTSGCVRASCVDAMSHGFRVAVARHACGDRHSAPHDANLFDMDAKYADVVEEDEVVSFLRRTAVGSDG
jgi:maleamate amidohydrolase